EHVHLPVQSGSDKILDLMNRKYTIGEYLDKIKSLRDMIPDVGISTDIIVGFPSEKGSDYAKTRKIMEEIRYDSAFIFKYSPRSPALSACLMDDVPDETRKERNNELLKIQKSISRAKNKEIIGSDREILIDGVSRMSNGELVGRTRNNTPCVFPGHTNLIGSFVRVKVTGSSPFTLKGEII
ncbi:MAG: TRAM domain-containing protein, partial [Candidatus Omnitrophica bacterium]|nr:TRAM domain-containing protein [Candidatus Omnitrophota bacterium]